MIPQKLLESTFRTIRKSEMKKKILKSITKIQNVLKVWRIHRLTLKVKL